MYKMPSLLVREASCAPTSVGNGTFSIAVNKLLSALEKLDAHVGTIIEKIKPNNDFLALYIFLTLSL